MKTTKGAVVIATTLAVLGLAACAATDTAGSTGEKTASMSSSSSSSSSSTTTEETVDAPAPAYTPKPSDFKIKVKVRKKECFGSAGCNVVYRIEPSYTGEPLEGTWSITYSVKGGEDGPQINTFTLEDDQASFDSEEIISTPRSSTKLTAVVTDITEE